MGERTVANFVREGETGLWDAEGQGRGQIRRCTFARFLSISCSLSI